MFRWNIEKVKDYETACWTKAEDDEYGRVRLEVVTEALVNGAGFIGINEITKRNYEKVYMRYEMARFASEPVAQVFDPKKGHLVARRITLEEVKAHIGLWTNATRLTDAQYKKRLIEHISDRAKRCLQYAKEDSAKGGE